MEDDKKWTLPPKDQILREIEEDQVLIERAKRRCAEAPRVILEHEEAVRGVRQIIRQLART